MRFAGLLAGEFAPQLACRLPRLYRLLGLIPVVEQQGAEHQMAGGQVMAERRDARMFAGEPRPEVAGLGERPQRLVRSSDVQLAGGVDARRPGREASEFGRVWVATQ